MKLNNLSKIYVKDKKKIKVLDNINISFSKGKFYGIIGKSGAGKTTLVKLLMRFYELNGGTIYVDGHDIKDYTRSDLRSLFGMVLQDTWLYSGSIKDNIKYGKLDATDEEVLFAAKLANCDEFASKMPNGYNTEIGENGCNLSGGERQRISIARAFLKNAPIILLDEATASLDVENETLIQTALSRLIKDKTVIVIAHRMRTVENADKIIVLANGTVAESGTPNELMNKNGLFRHMVERQTASQNWTI